MVYWNVSTIEGAKSAVRELINFFGDDPSREGLEETPERFLRGWRELLAGYNQSPEDLMKTFKDGCCDELVIVKGIDFVSLCEHHLLPFTGVAHVGYLPNERIIGLSKIPRLVDVFARRLQVQERLTTQITNALMEHLKPRGAGCVVEATHFCLSCRGAKKQNAVMVTSSLTGVIREDPKTRKEFFDLIKSK